MILVSGVGYTNLSDMSFGRVLLGELEKLEWPPHVHIADLNFGPIMIYQWLEEIPIKFDRWILISAEKRGRRPGTLEIYRWNRPPASPDEIQASIGEAVTGVISLENLLLICRHFDVLPEDVTIVEIEPERDEFGMEFSQVVAEKVDAALRAVQTIVKAGDTPASAV